MKTIEIDEFIAINKLEMPDPVIFQKLVDNLSFYKDDSGQVGNVNYERGLLLYGLVSKFRPKNILEFGTAKGFSTICMALTLSQNKIGMIDTIDLIGHDEKISHVIKTTESVSEIETSRRQLWKTTVESELLDHVRTIHGYSGALTQKSDLPKFDFFYIDASHFYEAVKNDFFISLLLSNDNAVYVLDDYIERADFGVKQLVDNEISKCADVTLIRTDRTNYHLKNNTTKSDYGMCFFQLNRDEAVNYFGKNEINSFIKKHSSFEKRYALRKKINQKIPFLEKIRFKRLVFK